MNFFIPPTHVVFEVTEDTLVSIDWLPRNMQIMKRLKLTDKVESYRYKYKDYKTGETKEQITYTLPVNPLFKDDKDKTIPIDMEIPVGTEIELLKFIIGRPAGAAIQSPKTVLRIQGRFLSSTNKDIKGRSFELQVAEINKIKVKEKN